MYASAYLRCVRLRATAAVTPVLYIPQPYAATVQSCSCSYDPRLTPVSGMAQVLSKHQNKIHFPLSKLTITTGRSCVAADPSLTAGIISSCKSTRSTAVYYSISSSSEVLHHTADVDGGRRMEMNSSRGFHFSPR